MGKNKTVFLLLIQYFALASSAWAQDWIITHSESKIDGQQVIEVQFNLKSYQLTQREEGDKTFSDLVLKQSVSSIDEGLPAVPFVHATFQIENENFEITEVKNEYEDKVLSQAMIPGRGKVTRSGPQKPFAIAAGVKEQDNFYPVQITRKNSFNLRGAKGATVYIYPFQFNYSNNTLRVYKSLSFKIVTANKQVREAVDAKKNSQNIALKKTYKNIFLNSKNEKVLNSEQVARDADSVSALQEESSREGAEVQAEQEVKNLLEEQGSILALYTGRDKKAAERYALWKRRKGVKVYTKELASGTNAKETIKEHYEAHKDIMYVQIFGGWNDIKSDTSYFDYASGQAPMDPALGFLEGDDVYPELIVGRFPGEAAHEVELQVSKTIAYERDEYISVLFYDKGDTLESQKNVFKTWKEGLGESIVEIEIDRKGGPSAAEVIRKLQAKKVNVISVYLLGDKSEIPFEKEDFKELYVESYKGMINLMSATIDGMLKGNDRRVYQFEESQKNELRAEATTELENYVHSDFRSVSLMIGSNEGAGAGDDGERDKDHLKNITESKLFAYDFLNSFFRFEGDTFETKTTESVASDVEKDVNSGVGYINYTGHGTDDAWVTTEFSVSDIEKLKNRGKWPFIVSVACLNGAFHQNSGQSFAEAWVKKKNAGAVVTLMSTILQPWLPPMRAQDYFNDLMIGGYEYSNIAGQDGIDVDFQRTTFGSLALNAQVFMLNESNQLSEKDTIKTWTIFGDANLQVRTQKPIDVKLNYKLQLGKDFDMQVTTKDGGKKVVNALVSFYSDSFEDKTPIVARTNSEGRAKFNYSILKKINPLTKDLVVTVSGRNLNTQVVSLSITGNKQLKQIAEPVKEIADQVVSGFGDIADKVSKFFGL